MAQEAAEKQQSVEEQRRAWRQAQAFGEDLSASIAGHVISYHDFNGPRNVRMRDHDDVLNELERGFPPAIDSKKIYPYALKFDKQGFVYPERLKLSDFGGSVSPTDTEKASFDHAMEMAGLHLRASQGSEPCVYCTTPEALESDLQRMGVVDAYVDHTGAVIERVEKQHNEEQTERIADKYLAQTQEKWQANEQKTTQQSSPQASQTTTTALPNVLDELDSGGSIAKTLNTAKNLTPKNDGSEDTPKF